MAENIFRLFLEIIKTDDSFRILVTTRDAEYFEELIKKTQMDTRYIKQISVPHYEISKYLSCADYWIVYRHDIIVNNIASPIKVAEKIADFIREKISVRK